MKKNVYIYILYTYMYTYIYRESTYHSAWHSTLYKLSIPCRDPLKNDPDHREANGL